MSAMFSKPKTPKTAATPPDPDDTGPVAIEERRKRLAAVTARSGRDSTMMTPPTVMGDYSPNRTTG